ncbi:hypothetical protein [Nitratidesulfovibrio sp. 1201_IL3209]|uniref:hypothetical protein n=1 Tax=Nitratidesulfovibrio sp. 1201_IL3209 TaxID=3084053 RepID=UPI002FD99262
MGTRTVIFCDLCGCESSDVKTRNLAYGRETCPAEGRTHDVFASADLCPECVKEIDWIVRAISGTAKKDASPEVIARATLFHATAKGRFRVPSRREK